MVSSLSKNNLCCRKRKEKTMLDDGYISIEEAASYLGVKTITLRGWLKKRESEIPAHKIGKLWKFKRSELDIWVQSGKSAIRIGECDEHEQ